LVLNLVTIKRWYKKVGKWSWVQAKSKKEIQNFESQRIAPQNNIQTTYI